MIDPITLRYSKDGDRERIAELAELDGRPAPTGEVLLAEAEGRLVAAVGMTDGAAVADPFRPTADVVELMQMRVEQDREALARPRTPDRSPCLIRQRDGIFFFFFLNSPGRSPDVTGRAA